MIVVGGFYQGVGGPVAHLIKVVDHNEQKGEVTFQHCSGHGVIHTGPTTRSVDNFLDLYQPAD